ncbi:MAG TPA: hypothetical protein VN686_01480 [Gaiellales bacterium]|nr:hypothetical protein [Gaiellales bacterium]
MTEPLARLLEEAREGRIQVPEFQRELILTDEWIRACSPASRSAIRSER